MALATNSDHSGMHHKKIMQVESWPSGEKEDAEDNGSILAFDSGQDKAKQAESSKENEDEEVSIISENQDADLSCSEARLVK